MAIIDVVEWSPRGNNVYAWRYPESNLSTATQLVVRESQEAVFFSKGQILGKFGPGKHRLTTENLPILRKLYGIPFGGTNPFFAEVWFVNKAMPLTIDWRTNSMRIMDPDYGAMVPICATGRYGVKVRDAEKFLVKLIGTMREFTASDLTDHFMGPLTSKTNSVIASYMTANRVGITQIAMQLDQLSNFISQPMAEFWDEYGLELTGFYITSIDVDTSSESGRRIAEALADRSTQNIAGYTWQQRQSFDTARAAMESGSDMGILGMAMMGGMFSGGGAGGGLGAGMMQQPGQYGFNAGPGYGRQDAMGFGGFGQAEGYGQQGRGGYANDMGGSRGFGAGRAGYGAGPGNGQMPVAGGGYAPGGGAQRRQVFCANCGRTFDASSRFCPNCGHEYNPCPVCGSDNQTNAHRCVTCGAQLASARNLGADTECPRCHAQVPPGTKFCPQCGKKLGQ